MRPNNSFKSNPHRGGETQALELMSEIIVAITNWPIILQGVLGSALFWVVLELGQRGTRRMMGRFGKDKQTANWFAAAAHSLPAGEALEQARFVCLYGATHYAAKGFIVAILSVALAGFVQVIAIVGFLISGYFFFRALSFVPHSSKFPDSVRNRFLEDLYQEKKDRPQT